MNVPQKTTVAMSMQTVSTHQDRIGVHAKKALMEMAFHARVRNPSDVGFPLDTTRFGRIVKKGKENLTFNTKNAKLRIQLFNTNSILQVQE